MALEGKQLLHLVSPYKEMETTTIQYIAKDHTAGDHVVLKPGICVPEFTLA